MAYFETRAFTREKPLDAWESVSFSFRAHWQQEVELMFVLEGSQGVSVGNRRAVLHAGDLAVAGVREVHAYDAASEDGRIAIAIVDASFLREQAGWTERHVLVPPFAHRPDLAPQFRTLATEGRTGGPHHAVAMKAAALAVFAALLRMPECGLREEGASASGPDGTVLHRALGYLEARFAEEVTLASLAAHLSLSASHVSRLFRRATGMTFRGYLNHLRVERASAMLRDPDRSITEIAYACGFGSLRTFHRAFRDVAGTTPKRSRRTAPGS
jgi:AraC-like DNA-binding protein